MNQYKSHVENAVIGLHGILQDNGEDTIEDTDKVTREISRVYDESDNFNIIRRIINHDKPMEQQLAEIYTLVQRYENQAFDI